MHGVCLVGGRSTEGEVHLRRSAAFKLFPSHRMVPWQKDHHHTVMAGGVANNSH